MKIWGWLKYKESRYQWSPARLDAIPVESSFYYVLINLCKKGLCCDWRLYRFRVQFVLRKSCLVILSSLYSICLNRTFRSFLPLPWCPTREHLAEIVHQGSTLSRLSAQNISSLLERPDKASFSVSKCCSGKIKTNQVQVKIIWLSTRSKYRGYSPRPIGCRIGSQSQRDSVHFNLFELSCQTKTKNPDLKLFLDPLSASSHSLSSGFLAFCGWL